MDDDEINRSFALYLSGQMNWLELLRILEDAGALRVIAETLGAEYADLLQRSRQT